MKNKNNKKNIKKLFSIPFIVFAFSFFSFFLTNPVWAAIGPNVTITANPGTVDSGYTSTITWEGTDVEGCSINNGPPVNTSGSLVTPPLYTKTTYNIQCYYHVGDDSDPDMEIKYRNDFVTIYIRETGVEPLDITEITTKEATGVKYTEATLRGSLNPGGRGVPASADAYFRYSTVDNNPPIFCNDIFGSKMRATNEIEVWGNSLQDVNITVGGLSPGETYYYCMVGSNENQIDYGGVMSFTTPLYDYAAGLGDHSLGINTRNPLVVDTTSAYLKGFFNTSVPADTYFEYRRTGFENNNTGIGNVSLGEKILEMFQIKKAKAQTASNFAWNKVGNEKRNPKSNGSMSYLLSGLLPSTIYQYRAVIKVDEEFLERGGQYVGPSILYGTIYNFTTKSSGESGPGTGGGIGYEDPCDNPLYDPNCNGTGGSGASGKVIGPGLPDLTTGSISPTTFSQNIPVTLRAQIQNQGKGATGKSFYAFFQTSTTNPSLQKTEKQGGNGPAGTALNSFKKFFDIEKASAAVNTTAGNSMTALGNTGNNISAILVPALMGRSSSVISQEFTFPIGAYYVRACADKSSINDSGVVTESYENNNCGPWTTITARNYIVPPGGGTCTDPNAQNPGSPLPCIYGSAFCTDPGAINPGSPLPCIYTYGICADPNALNFNEPLPCQYAQIPPECINGADDPPLCTINPEGCANGADNPPLCTLSSGGCANGADNPPLCDNLDDCPNGADNPPICTTTTNPMTCRNSSAKNYGSPLPCIFSAGNCLDSKAKNYADGLPCQYDEGMSDLVLGQVATPPSDAIVRYHEGIEHVFVRQILKNANIQRLYGYNGSGDLQTFAWNLADLLARTFGYVAENSREIRVSLPDIAAYELRLTGSQLTVYEYFDSVIVNIESTMTALREIYEYEYYYTK